MAKELDMLNKSLQENLDLTAYSQVGHTHNYAGSSTAGGAATSATKLATARKINGTSFNGTGDITTANWGTARTITIGNSGKSVNGSANVSWTLAEIGAAASGHTHNILKYVDTRSVNTAPKDYNISGIQPEFKSTSTIGLPSDTGTYAGTLTYQQWTDVSNWSGGKITQFATVNDGRMFYRKGDGSGWGSWYQFYTTQNKPTYSDVGAAAASHGTHVTYATATPSANGTAAVGTSSKVAREDHVHPLQTTISGAAGSAGKWTTARTLTIGNTGKSVDGSANVTWTLSEIGALPLSGGTMTGGIKRSSFPSTWVAAAKDSNALTNSTASAGVFSPFFSAKTTNGSIVLAAYQTGIQGAYLTKANVDANTNTTSKTVTLMDENGGGSWSGTVSANSFTEGGTALSNKYAAKSHGTHVTYATATPSANGTAAVGTSSKVAREDHVHPLQSSVAKLTTARTITIGNKSNNFDGSGNISYSLADMGSTESVVWTASIKCATWSRLFQYKVTDNATVGGTYLVNIRATRSSVVYNPTLLVNFSHATKAKIVQLNNTEYSNIKVRCVVDNNGAGYFEIYDNVNSATNSTTQSVFVTVIKLSATLNITKYTSFTDGTTVPTNYTAAGEMTTISGTVYSGTAAKATILATTRTINGTNFNGSGNITTANWGTARNLQIGNSSKSVNGSGNVSWTLSEIGAVAKTGDTMTGPLKINGAASTLPLQVRGVVGSLADGSAVDDLYLQYGTNKKIILGNAGGYEISADGSSYTGKAAKAGNADTATKLATGRSITIGNQAQTFDGSANISFSVASIGAAASSHTHNYAGSSSAGGAANSVKTNLIIKLNGGSTEGTNLFTFNGSTAKTVNITPSAIGAAASSHGTHVTYSTSAPLVAGTASVGSANNVARGDHVHPAQTSVSGNAGTATKLQTARTITIGNKSNTFDGSANISYTLADIGAAPTSHDHQHLLGEDLSSKTISLDTLNLSSGTPKFKVYFCPTDGGGSNITGRPNDSYKTAFNLIVESLRFASTTDYITKQTYTRGGERVVYIRYCTSGTWTAWEKVYTSAQKPTYSDVGAAAASHGTHVTWSTTTPKANGTAAVGSETKVARGDHVHPLQTTVSGNAGTATKLATARTLTIGNTGKTFDGSANVSWSLAEIGALALTGGTLSGRLTADGKITLPTTGSSWISGMTPSNASIEIKTQQSSGSYHPILAVKTASEHVANIGGLNNDFGFYGFKAGRTANATDWSFKVDAASGNWTMTGSLTSGGSIIPSNAITANLGSAAKPWNIAYADHFQVYGEASKQYGFLGAVTTGTTSATGETRLVLGNGTATGTASNSYGRIYMYGTSSGYTALTPGNNTTSNITLTLPSGGGTLARTSDSITGNAATATKLANARTLTIGSTGKTFDGSANVSWTLAEIGAAASSHSHNVLSVKSDNYKDANALPSTYDRGETVFFSNNPTNKFNGITYCTVHTIKGYGNMACIQYIYPYNSGDDKIYYRTAQYNSDTWRSWATVYSSLNKPTPADIGAAAASHGTHVTYATATPSAHGTAAVGSSAKVAREDHVHPLQASAATWTTARTLTIGNTGKSVNGSANVSWSLAEIGAAASSHSHNSINYQDTRSVNTTAKDVPSGLSVHLKSNGTDGISDGGSYHPVLMMKPWNDKSGWPVGQLAVTQNNNLYFRVSSGADDTSWNAWKKVSLDGHTHNTGGTVTAVASDLTSVTINSYDSILSGINTNIGNL